MSNSNANIINNSPNARSAFATSSSDFALPFGSRSSTNSNSNDNNNGFFQIASSSVPVSIPTSPCLSLSFNQANQHAPLISLSGPGAASSPSKSASAGLGIGNLPSPSASTRDQSDTLVPPHSPTLPLSLAGEGWPQPPAFTSLPFSLSYSSSQGGVTAPASLLRRAPAMASPGFSLNSPARFRRASMLGREITPFHLDSGSDEEVNTASTSASTDNAITTTSEHKRVLNPDPDDGDDEMMQMEEDDPCTTANTPSTPLMGPPMSLFPSANTPPPAQACSCSQQHPVRPSMSALARTSASDSGQDSSSSTNSTSTIATNNNDNNSNNNNNNNNNLFGLSRSAVPRSPCSSNPSMGSPLGGNRSRSSSLLSSNVVRKAVTRRGNLLPKDRSMARVAASLQDESKPEDSEIASEAKLQKRLGGEATLPLPRTPRFGPSASTASMIAASAVGMRSPFFAPSTSATAAASGSGFGSSRRKYMWDDDVDDIRGVFAADGLDDGESSNLSSEEEEEMMMFYSREMGSGFDEDEDEIRNDGGDSTMMQDTSSTSATANDANHGARGSLTSGSMPVSTSFGSSTSTTTIGAGGAGGSSAVGSLPKRKNNSLWMGFRDKGNSHKWSPGGAASSTSSCSSSSAAVTLSRRTAASASAMGMDLETSPRVLAPTSARLSKRKTMGEDRYEPYKRRAVSPMNLGSSLGTVATTASFCGGGGGGGGATNMINPTSGGVRDNGSNSPLLMPISSPGGGMLFRGIHAHHHYHSTTYVNRYSTSPTISRPCTPVNSITTTSTGTVVTAGMGSFSPVASGSGPGYGSGALGLSISANTHHSQTLESRIQLEQQQQNEALMDQRVGMLGLS